MKKLIMLVIAITVVATLGCIEKNKNIESYRMTETELPEGIIEKDFEMGESGDFGEKAMTIHYGSTRARGTMLLLVVDRVTKESAQERFKIHEPEFGHSGPSRLEGRIDGRFIVVVSWYDPHFPEEDALWIFNNAG